MKFIAEPSIDIKMRRMRERVRWQHPAIRERGIDQTRLCVEQAPADFEEFSFLVVGDSGTGRHRTSSPQRQVAESLVAAGETVQFVLHTGDVVYLVGSSEQYRENFIKPYREWLVGGDAYRKIAYDRMVFKVPFFPVPGNHDYYDLSAPWGVVAGITAPLRYVFQSYLDLDVGWHGSFQGDAYARAFMDYLAGVPEGRLAAHLDQHYTSRVEGDRCLTYCPGSFTRLPNRYYTFRYAGIDFFALDSNTFNQPLPIVDSADEGDYRARLQIKRQKLAAHKTELQRQLSTALMSPLQQDDHEDIQGKIEAVDEEIHDIDKQLGGTQILDVDQQQLNWLRDRLIASWQNPAVRGRILIFHHPPYVTESTKWQQGQTLAVRYRLRQVLDGVKAEVGDIARNKPLVDLVLCGHAHCMEYLQTRDTGYADSHIAWVICGGSGYSLRRQRTEGPDLTEDIEGNGKVIATSKLFLGRSGKGSTLRRPYSGLRVRIGSGPAPTLNITGLIAEKFDGEWSRRTVEVLNPNVHP